MSVKNKTGQSSRLVLCCGQKLPPHPPGVARQPLPIALPMRSSAAFHLGPGAPSWIWSRRGRTFVIAPLSAWSSSSSALMIARNSPTSSERGARSHMNSPPQTNVARMTRGKPLLRWRFGPMPSSERLRAVSCTIQSFLAALPQHNLRYIPAHRSPHRIGGGNSMERVELCKRECDDGDAIRSARCAPT